MRIIFGIIIIFIYSIGNAGSGADDPLTGWTAFAKSSESRKLVSWIMSGIECEMKGSLYPDLDVKTPAYYGTLGIFLTIIKGKEVRGCFGAMDHKSDRLNLTLREYIRGALASDPRYKPLEQDELESVSVIVTIAGRPFPIDDINEIDVSSSGIMISKEESTIILVPAEIRSKDRLKPLIKGADVFAFSAVCIK